MEIKIKKAASPCKNSKKDKMRKSKKIKTEINKFNYIIWIYLFSINPLQPIKGNPNLLGIQRHSSNITATSY